MEIMKRHSLRMGAGLVIAAILATGCGPGNAASDKAGGSGEPQVLTMATFFGDVDFTPQIRYLVDRVEELSEGDLQIEIEYAVGAFAASAEQEVVRGVADGTFDLGFVGTQVFDSLGFDNFRALIAPMLIDSYALQDSVLDSGLTDEMMDGIDEVGVTGLKVLGGTLRKPVAVKQPLLGPADWRGITFGVNRSETQGDAIRALAASPMEVIGDTRDEAMEKGSIDGFESSLLAYKLNGQERAAPYVTANVNLWPQTLVVMGNPDAVAGLSETRRAWLQQAADESAARSTELKDADLDTVAGICESGGRFAFASSADLAALQRDFEAAYVALEKDTATKGFIEQI